MTSQLATVTIPVVVYRALVDTAHAAHGLREALDDWEPTPTSKGEEEKRLIQSTLAMVKEIESLPTVRRERA